MQTVVLLKVKMGLNIRPKDEVYIFVYDKDQIYIPSVSRIYGSDFRKLSDVSRPDNLDQRIVTRILHFTSYTTDSIGGTQVWALPTLRGVHNLL